ncbi:MAG: rRNA maturation RNase YbeY [Oligoflexia bacterium]|nr:rRNA maturation RNase YbeY [Oligoflexia bacterium]MBF0365998.1 rRNA maturation RNase YbeY [Oligoflexia bacterium]
MNLTIEFDTSIKSWRSGEEQLLQQLIRRLCKAVLQEKWFLQQKLGTVMCHVWVVGAKRIQGMNKVYRRKDKVTDVLSFPQYDQQWWNSSLKKRKAHPCMHLGDVVVCYQKALQDAKCFGISFEEEIATLLVHGVLHLVGFDHERSKLEEKRMFSLQEKLVNTILKKAKV